MRAEALRAIGGYRNAYPHAEDYDLFIRLAAHGTIDNPPKEVLFYRRHADAVSVKNLDVQERSAVSAECDAIAAAGFGAPQPWLIEPYTRLRIFRRLQTIDIHQAGGYVGRMLWDLLHPAPVRLLSRKYARLRGIMAFNLVKFGYRRFKASLRRAGGKTARAA